MIKFFRKIRQRLLSENKFSKYLVYAVGEIILVVIGILIAIQLNSIKNQRESRNEEITHLENLLADLKQDKTELNRMIERRESKLNSTERPSVRPSVRPSRLACYRDKVPGNNQITLLSHRHVLHMKI